MASSRTVTRILIGAGCFADADAAMRLTDRILASIPAELGGVLIEDDAMADIAHVPTQRVVTPGGALMVPPSTNELRITAESDARAFRNKLATIARTRSTTWHFERRGGDLILGLFEAAKGWDILLLGYREMHKRPGQVVVLTVASEGVSRARAFADELALVLNASVQELSTSGVDEQSDLNGSVHGAVEREPALFAQMSRINASAVVVDLAAGPLRSKEHLHRLLEAARCPVFVLGAEQGARRSGSQ